MKGINPIALPIDPLLPQIISSLGRHRNLVLQASPGSGKTTRAPGAVLKTLPHSQVWVLEPRRLAAKLSAQRVADELGERVGESVGYHFRFELQETKKTKLLFLTEGMMIRRLMNNPHLQGVGAVILDEFHERSLHADTALAYVRQLQLTARPDLKIVVMSATIDPLPLSRYLDNCPNLQLDAPLYPITTTYLAKTGEDHPLERKVYQSVANALCDPSTHDILVFLPGIADIRRAEMALERLRTAHNILITPLHGELERDEQDQALRPATRRKVILATNIAETSLTIEGVNMVIDSGLYRVASYSWWSGVPSLKTKPISRASAIQRAGRSARTGPGRCVRLYPKSDFDARPAFETPEIRRADLTQLLLELKILGVIDFLKFPWFEAPAEAAVAASEKLLVRLGAFINGSSRLTAIGQRMAAFPAHPRLARVLVEAEKRGVAEWGANVAALIAEGSLDRMDALEQAARATFSGPLKKARDQFLAQIKKLEMISSEDLRRDALAQSLLTGFSDRVARRRSHARGRQGETELVLAAGGSARVADSEVIAEGEYFIVLDIQEEQHTSQLRSQLRVRAVCPIIVDWLLELDPCPVSERDTFSWNPNGQKVQAVSALVVDEMVLTESPNRTAKASAEAFRVLLREGLNLDPERLSSTSPLEFCQMLSSVLNKEKWENWLARLQLLRKYQSEAQVPEWETLRAAFLKLFSGCLALSEFKATDWISAAGEFLPANLPNLLDRLLPQQFTLPSGRRAPIVYSLDQEPYLASKLQDFFGLKQAPQLLNGRLPLTLHLLAPNKRAVQVTRDLTGFWEREYPRLRKELGRKYPRHSWPENPH